MGNENIANKGNPKFCVQCGEPSPFDKIEYSIKKVHILYELSISNKPISVSPQNNENKCFCVLERGPEISSFNEDMQKREIERVLLEQCIVSFATGIELFLKEIFIISMDFKFVKSQYSLFAKFYKDTKNEFLNMGKLNARFKDELEIDLKTALGEDIFKKLNVLLLKRNAIVHNNGFADKTFIAQSGIEIKSGNKIPISIDEIEKYFSTVELVIEKIKVLFDQIFLPEFKNKIEFHILN